MADVVRRNLGADPIRLAKEGALAHPDHLPGFGIVPDLPEWEYRFHGRGCMLTRRKDGLEIDVDFVDDSAEFIDGFFYRNYLKSLREPGPVEGRILELHPSIDAIEISLKALHQAGLIVGKSSDHFSLSDEVVRRSDEILSALRRWESHDIAQDVAPFFIWLASGEREEAGRSERRQRLIAGATSDAGAAAIRGMADVGAPELESQFRKALQGTSGGAMSAALELISKSDDPKWCQELFAVLARKPLGMADGLLYAQKLCLEFLFRHSFRPQDLRITLSRDWDVMDGEVGLIAMEHAPDMALSILRRSLRSRIPLCRQQAAAILALFDRPWSRRELSAVLNESDDHHLTAAARAGLRFCHDSQAAEALAQWELTHYRPPIEGKWIKMDDAILRHTDEFVAGYMEDFHDRVMKIRDVEPP